MDFSNYLADKLIDATVRNIPYDTPEDVFIALYTTDPTKEDIGSEVREPSYNRQEIVMSVPVEGQSENSAQIDFAEATSNWGLITHIGIRDQAYDGNLMYFTAIDNPKNILTGDQFKVNADKLKLTLT
jgi:hypothetical protein